MTADKIKAAALAHFANHGYSGASLSGIASDVGIKTPSIYAHFKNKDELFLAVTEEAIAHEWEKATAYFNDSSLSFKEKLYGFLQLQMENYEQDERAKFWLRTSFFPPEHLEEQLMDHVYSYLDKMESLLLQEFKEAKEPGLQDLNIKYAAKAYIALLDGVFVEMLYGGEGSAEERLEASWYMYERALFN
ncbi:TetR/AcrR family transcriptional regulator [Fictibacillus sp. KIGAM418]|uniref:TetR/AcrR family transcriptional regulator n=1 Tax=Fictibacillus marinisediminis TaxID=2878389 RepID=A0A9X1X947_9BACL|nr:TetR/AcrR family transcriptional regulator [Fictibacillus marinisediminis]MCK6255425.1 TetR/AcrR family transcriptional regulator [Fictibacillus marinisediminis]